MPSWKAPRSTIRSVGQLALAASPWVPTSGPTSSSAITTEFLTASVAAGIDGARCLRAEPLDGTSGTTDRRRLGLLWNDRGIAAGLPSTVFVKSTPLTTKNRCMVAPLDMATNEVRFYNDIRPGLAGHAPVVWHAYAGGGGRFLLLLEDLLAQGARPYALADECPVEHARAILDAQASLHAAMWESPRLSGDLAWVKPWSQRPGYLMLRELYRRCRRSTLKKYGDDLTPAERRLAEVLNRHDEVMYREMERGPLTVLHGDPHLGNTYGMPDGEAGFLDWQVVWQGPGLRDVGYFLLSALEPGLRREALPELIQHYLDALSARGVSAPSYDEAFRRLCIFAGEFADAAAVIRVWPGLQSPENVAAAERRGRGVAEELPIADALEDAAARE